LLNCRSELSAGNNNINFSFLDFISAFIAFLNQPTLEFPKSDLPINQ
jgi:hypothetical protein